MAPPPATFTSSSPIFFFFIISTLLSTSISSPEYLTGNKNNNKNNNTNNNGLSYNFYEKTCPDVEKIVQSEVTKAFNKEARMAASLIRLSFHDCFVQGCDASVLLDNSSSIISEKGSNPNRNSARGFDVVDNIKAAVEKACPHTVSCADILFIAARDSSVLSKGPYWKVALGRRDSRSASLSGSNNNIPAPNNTFSTILTKFKRFGLDLVDLVALSGSHTIGNSRCTSFRQRLYNQTGNGKPDPTLDASYANKLRGNCPRSGGDNNLFFLDPDTPKTFDSNYFKLLIKKKGLLNSDEVLYTSSTSSADLVKKYAGDEAGFAKQFAASMVKMGNIAPLLGKRGEIRKHCRMVNSN